MSIEPFTFFIHRIAVMNRPVTASSAHMPWVWKSVRKLVIVTRVDASTQRPAFCRPINAIKRPIPTDTPFFRETGMALKIASRTVVRDRMIKIIPSQNTANSAVCHGTPMLATTV